MIRERTSYSCVCDGCGCEQFDDYWSEDAALTQAVDDGWTYCEDSQGDWETYCPNCHPMYVCHHCGLESDCNEPGWQERDGHVDCPNHLPTAANAAATTSAPDTASNTRDGATNSTCAPTTIRKGIANEPQTLRKATASS